jgi:hypothetical protein
LIVLECATGVQRHRVVGIDPCDEVDVLGARQWVLGLALVKAVPAKR